MSDIFKTLRESNAALLKAEAVDLAKWSKLKHTKGDLETFLQFNLAEIEFKTLDSGYTSIICTSNTALIKILDTKKPEDKKKLVNFKSAGIQTKDLKSVLTWDLVENTYKTISLNTWQITNFISITPENVLILDELINKILK